MVARTFPHMHPSKVVGAHPGRVTHCRAHSSVSASGLGCKLPRPTVISVHRISADPAKSIVISPLQIPGPKAQNDTECRTIERLATALALYSQCDAVKSTQKMG